MGSLPSVPEGSFALTAKTLAVRLLEAKVRRLLLPLLRPLPNERRPIDKLRARCQPLPLPLPLPPPLYSATGSGSVSESVEGGGGRAAAALGRRVRFFAATPRGVTTSSSNCTVLELSLE